MPIDLSRFNAYWTFSSSSGIAADGPTRPWNNVTPVPSGSNFAFLQNQGSMEQAFVATTGGAYTISYYAQDRGFPAPQTIRVLLDGTVASTPGTIGQYAWSVHSFATASLSAGMHTLRFEGVGTNGAMLIDSVVITGPYPSSTVVTLANSNFDSYLLSPDAYVYNPPAIATASYRLVATVTTCGKWLFCRLTKISDGSDVAFTTINEAPIVYVNGISQGAIQTGAMVSTPVHTGVLIPLPNGVVVNASQSVTLSASAGWVFGPNGYAEAMSAQPATNKVGQSFYRQPNVPRTMDLGTGFAAQVTPEWNPLTLMKNWRYRAAFAVPTLVSADSGGKPVVLAGTPTYFPLINVTSVNNIDGTGFPTPTGYWAVRWDDLDGGSLFSLSTHGDSNGSITEVTSLANPGVGGIGKVKVYNVQGVGSATQFQVWLRLDKTDLNPHFDNLAILAPGDFTWTANTPTVIPVPSSSDISSIQTTRMPTQYSFGPFRFNDSTVGVGGVNPACEKEHMVNPGDFHWAQDVKVYNGFGYDSARPWNPATSPYIYTTQFGSTFSATLASTISTTPAAGTQEVVTISDAATAPVLPSLVLIIDSERCRVISVSGTSVTIERGSESTTPATHSPGTISVNGRKAMANLAAWGGTNWQLAELVTHVPHRLRTGQIVTFQGAGWPAWTYSDGRGFYGGTYSGWSLYAFVTGANTFVTLFNNVSPVNPLNTTLSATYNLNPATCTTGDYYPDYGGSPYELAATMAAQYPGSPCWVSIPTAASDDMIDEIARRTLANLPTGHQVWIEYQDEPWNFAYKNAKYNQVLDNILYGGGSTNTLWVAHRTGQIKQRFKNVFATQGRGSDVKSLINMQLGASGNLAYILSVMNGEGYIPDAIAVAPYYDIYPNPAIYKACAAFTTDMVVDLLTWDAQYGHSSGGYNWGGHTAVNMAAWKSAIATANTTYGSNTQLNIYEYGSNLPAPYFASSLGASMDAATQTLVLSAGESATPLTMDYFDAAKVQPGTWLLVGSEWMTVVSRSGATCTVNRGQNGTTATSHSNGAFVRNDYLEFIRDVTLHPNWGVFTGDQFALFQTNGVRLCICSSSSGVWASGHAWDDYHSFNQLPGKGDGSDGRANNLLCLARPGTGQKSSTVNQDANTVSVRGQAQIDWYTQASQPSNNGLTQMFLRQSTAASVLVGPVMDSSGAAVTTAVIGDFNLSKNGATAALASPTTATHSHNGHYFIGLTAGNTDTLGRAVVTVNNTSDGMPPMGFTVLPGANYDAIVANLAGASGGLFIAGSTNADITVNLIGNVTGSVGTVSNPVAINMTQSVPVQNTPQTLGDALNAARAQGFGKWTIVGGVVSLYDASGNTVVHTLTLNPAPADSSRV